MSGRSKVNMKKAGGVTTFYINSGEYVYRESGGNRIYPTINSNSGRGIEPGLNILRGKTKRTTR